MKISIRRCLWFLVVCFGLSRVPAVGQSAESAREQNLSACKSALGSCDLSKLTPSELSEVAFVEHQRDVSNCRDSERFCDHSKLTQPEANALAVAEYRHNISDCMEVDPVRSAGCGYCRTPA